MATDTPDRQLVWIVLGIVAALVVLPAIAMAGGLLGMGPMMGGGWGHGMWGASDGVSSWLIVVAMGAQVVFLALLVGAGYLGYRALTRRDTSSDPAIEELRVAYARGDIDDDEFDRRRERLESER